MITEERDLLIDALEKHLDTRDKRFMFLKVSFGKIVNNIQIEGSASDTAWNIYTEFEKRNMLGSLMAHMNSVFEEKLMLTI